MSNANRKIAHSLYHHKYKHASSFFVEDKDKCVYCGEPWSVLDHFPALANAAYYSAYKPHTIFMLLPSCEECNALASDSMNETIDDRRDFVKRRLKRKYRSQIRRAKIWEKDDNNPWFDKTDYAYRLAKSDIETGKQAIERLSYKGHSLSVDGEIFRAGMFDKPCDEYIVFGKAFTDIDLCLQYCAQNFLVTDMKLKQSIAANPYQDTGKTIEDACEGFLLNFIKQEVAPIIGQSKTIFPKMFNSKGFIRMVRDMISIETPDDGVRDAIYLQWVSHCKNLKIQHEKYDSAVKSYLGK